MIKSMKIRLFPTKEQEVLMFKTVGCSRFTYNWALNRCNELYNQGIKYNMSDIRKEFTKLKKQEEYKWLNEVSNTTMVKAMRNLDKAFKDFFKGKSNYPTFKSKRKSRKSFYVRYNALRFKDNLCNIEKIGKVRFKTNYDIPLIYRKLSNIRNNHIHQTTAMIVKLKPYRIVMETLNIKGLMKNKHLSKAIQEQCLYEFIRQIKYKSEFYGIEFIQADKWYPSSKNCSNCGRYKQDLKLKDRVYKCICCGIEIDRDKNASYNLANYKLA